MASRTFREMVMVLYLGPSFGSEQGARNTNRFPERFLTCDQARRGPLKATTRPKKDQDPWLY